MPIAHRRVTQNLDQRYLHELGKKLEKYAKMLREMETGGKINIGPK